VPADLSASVDKFIQSLLEERLIMPASKMTNEIATIAQTDPAPLCPFEPIKMEKFTDMAEALIFDPVHDFDNNGWPVVRVEGTHPLIAEISTKILP
jgi:hypothetical protein